MMMIAGEVRPVGVSSLSLIVRQEFTCLSIQVWCVCVVVHGLTPSAWRSWISLDRSWSSFPAKVSSPGLACRTPQTRLCPAGTCMPESGSWWMGGWECGSVGVWWGGGGVMWVDGGGGGYSFVACLIIVFEVNFTESRTHLFSTSRRCAVRSYSSGSTPTPNRVTTKPTLSTFGLSLRFRQYPLGAISSLSFRRYHKGFYRREGSSSILSKH